MNRDRRENDSTLPPELASLFRGLYNRIARQLGVDPSYVSRVARRERTSEPILAALTKEMKSILDGVDHHNHDGASSHPDGKTRKHIGGAALLAKHGRNSAGDTNHHGRDGSSSDGKTAKRKPVGTARDKARPS